MKKRATQLLNVVAEDIKESKKFFSNNVDCDLGSVGESSSRTSPTKGLPLLQTADFTAFYQDILRRTSKSPNKENDQEEPKEAEIFDYPDEIPLDGYNKTLYNLPENIEEEDEACLDSYDGSANEIITEKIKSAPKRKTATTSLPKC